METVGGIVILWCAYYALTRGTQASWRAVKGAYRARAAAWSSRRQPPVPLSSGRKIAAGLATALTGGLLTARGWWAGAKLGWPEGRNRAQEWARRRAERQAAAPQATQPSTPSRTRLHREPGAAAVTLSAAPGEQAERQAAEPQAAQPSTPSRTRLHREPGPAAGTPSPTSGEQASELVPFPHSPAIAGTGTAPTADRDPAEWSRPHVVETGNGTRPALHAVPAPSVVPGPGGGSYPDAPATGGATHIPLTEGSRMEILNYEHCLAWLKKLMTESATEIDDAHAARARAAQDADQVELAWASLKSVDMDPETLSQVSALAEPFNQRKKAAEDRAAAAEQLHALAEATHRGVQARHNLMAEAHANTPHPADKQFYEG
jgi:hypothetical protein